jgi:hypothetical protein
MNHRAKRQIKKGKTPVRFFHVELRKSSSKNLRPDLIKSGKLSV